MASATFFVYVLFFPDPFRWNMTLFDQTYDVPETTRLLTRGVCKLFQDLGFGTLTEFKLANGRRVDVMAIDRNGEFVIVEVKSTVADFRGDRKWHEYLAFCERFYFAVPAGFPMDMMPDDCGLIVADPYTAAVRRESLTRKLNTNRKRRQLIRFALAASNRLSHNG
tara:strand:- start:2834 stop:3331 length:498 start_codon:yes stop_codon:yes gene_type:complete